MTAAKPAAEEKDGLDWEQESTGGSLFKFETVGQKLTGLLTNRKKGKTKLGEGTFFTILTAKGEHTFIPTKALCEDLEKFMRQYGGINRAIVEVEFSEEKKGNYPNPFKVFKVRAAPATPERLAKLGITLGVFPEDEIADDEAPH